MAYLIGQLSVLLAIAALFGGGLAGWSWHCIRNRDKWAAKDSQRARLREELLGFVGVDFGDPLPPLPAPLVDTGELEDLRARLAAAEERARAQEAACGDHVSKIASLEMELSSLRASLDNDAEAARFLALEESLRASQDKASDLERRAAELEDLLNQTSAPAPAEDGVDVAAMRWRIRDLEARLAKVDSDAAIARIVGPEPETAPAPQPDQEDALNRQRWQARYLQARVNYLEELSRQTRKAEPAPISVVTAPPVDEEAESRKRWRQRYLEARVAWLEGRG
jgi:DNA repair exonuclease SbcCD ATPase subunit